MSKKYRQKYDYKNYISHCPNCGAPLQKNATDCHACGINLVGYNEKQNMASNMSEYANKMKQMVEKNNQLNERIRQENKKQENKLKAKKMISFLPIAIILFLIIGVVVYFMIITALNEIKSQNKEEVVEYLQNTDDERVNVEIELIDDWEIKKEISDDGPDYKTTAYIGYDYNSKTTIVKEVYAKGEKEYAIIRLLPNDVSHLPKIDLYFNEMKYQGVNKSLYFSDYFIETERKSTVDDVFVQEFVYENMNFVSRLPTIVIQDTEIYTYLVGREYGSEVGDQFVAIVKMDETVFYVAVIKDYGEQECVELRNNLSQYFQIIKERG